MFTEPRDEERTSGSASPWFSSSWTMAPRWAAETTRSQRSAQRHWLCGSSVTRRAEEKSDFKQNQIVSDNVI